MSCIYISWSNYKILLATVHNFRIFARASLIREILMAQTMYLPHEAGQEVDNQVIFVPEKYTVLSNAAVWSACEIINRDYIWYYNPVLKHRLQ